MHITYGSAGNQKTWTWSGWVKRAKTGVQNDLWSMGSANNTFGIVYISSNDDFTFYEADSGGTTAFLGTNQLFRDPGAWYHILFVLDTTQSTADNRQRLYVNGTEVTSFANRTNPSLNADLKINSAAKHYLGGTSTGLSDLEWDGCMSQVIFVDGQALTPTSFGATNPVTNIWEPIAYTGTYGSNGYILNFSDSSALGDDTSGNTNDLTVSNIASTDQSTDTPSNNFAVLNGLHKVDDWSLAEGNLKFTNNSSGHRMTNSTIAPQTGKWYAEVKVTTVGGNYSHLGVINPDKFLYNTYLGNTGRGFAYSSEGLKVSSNSGSIYGNSFTTGDIIGIAMDLDNSKLYFHKNGTYQNSGVPTSGSTGTGSAFDLVSGEFYSFGLSSLDSGTDPVYEFNFGNPSFSISSGNADANGFGNFEYAVPSGYFSLCTKNLAEFG
jgi:hypothetical protein